jgi:hypothetical protein
MYKTGRKAVITDSRTLKLGKYVTAELPPPPPSRDWTKGITSFGMMLNGTDPNNPPEIPDGVGDCTIAAVGHAIQIWTANTGTELTVPNATILDFYQWWCGYVDGDPSTDQGGIEVNVLNEWRKHGFWGNKLLGYADPDVTNMTEIQQAIDLFGGVYIGLNVPQSVMNNANDPSIPWDVGGDETLVGGHAVFVPAYSPGLFRPISWGSPYTMTQAFWEKFVDESHALLGQDWLWKKSSPAGFNKNALLADLSAIT